MSNAQTNLRIGSGTGIFTRALLADPTFGPAVQELRAVEPSEGMRATFASKISDSRVHTYEGTFDHTNVEDGWADVVIVAQVRAHKSPEGIGQSRPTEIAFSYIGLSLVPGL